MEELLSTLFLLYILGSIFAGFFRRGSGSGTEGRPTGETPAPGFPEVLDMDDLERRLRELRSGKHEPDPPMTPAPMSQTSASTPAPQSSPAPPSAAQPPPAPVPTAARPTIVGSARPGSIPALFAEPSNGLDDSLDGADDWEEWADGALEAVSEPSVETPRSARAGQLPTTVETLIRKGHPWRAAVVLTELLGPPRALHPHRRRPLF